MSKEYAKKAMYEDRVESGWGSPLVEEEVDDLDFESGNFPLVHFMAYLEAIIMETPDEIKPYLFASFNEHGESWMTRPSVRIIRPKNDAERRRDQELALSKNRVQDEKDKREYERLKAKFDGK